MKHYETIEQNNIEQPLLRIPTGWRQTSWLFYKCSWDVEPGTTKIKFNEWSELVLNPGSQGKRPNRWATLPPVVFLCSGRIDLHESDRPSATRLKALYSNGMVFPCLLTFTCSRKATLNRLKSDLHVLTATAPLA